MEIILLIMGALCVAGIGTLLWLMVKFTLIVNDMAEIEKAIIRNISNLHETIQKKRPFEEEEETVIHMTEERDEKILKED